MTEKFDIHRKVFVKKCKKVSKVFVSIAEVYKAHNELKNKAVNAERLAVLTKWSGNLQHGDHVFSEGSTDFGVSCHWPTLSLRRCQHTF